MAPGGQVTPDALQPSLAVLTLRRNGEQGVDQDHQGHGGEAGVNPEI